MPHLILITGIMAAGKTSVAQAVAERLPRSVHLRGDVFRRMVINGRVDMSTPQTADARAQLDLRYRLAADAARSYLAVGFSVVYQDVILGDDLHRVLSYHSHRPLHVVILCPRREVVMARAGARDKGGYGGNITVAGLDEVLHASTPPIGLWLDSSDLTVAETADAVVARLAEAAIHERMP